MYLNLSSPTSDDSKSTALSNIPLSSAGYDPPCRIL